MSSLKIYTAQFTPKLGNLAANTQAILDLANHLAATNQADLLVLPELALTGAGLEDLLFKPSFLAEVEAALAKLATAIKNKDIGLLLGYPKQQAGKLYNAVGLLYEGKIQGEYFKRQLNPCLSERRYFTTGDLAENNTSTQPIEFNGYKLGLLMGEDLQQAAAIQAAYAAKADLLIAVSASPWHEGLHLERLQLAQKVSQQAQLPLIFCNQVGGQGEVVFDGASFALNANGEVLALAPVLEEASLSLTFLVTKQNKQLSSPTQQLANWPDELAYLYGVLVLGLKSYVNNRGFKGVVLGMSGGLDSALSAAIAVDALGASRVLGIMLPYHYTAAISQEDAAEQAQLMGINFEVMPIAPLVESFTQVLSPCFANLTKQEATASSQADTTEENLQARSRGVLLMALSNKLGLMLLTTSNKSEMAVGYCTLYGDMAGGFNALKDVYKTRVIELCTWRNSQGYVIPQRVIDRPPSAELAPNQLDENTLPPYPVLDALLTGYLEDDLSAEELIAKGFNAEEVNRILRLVDINEHKRRQSAPGIKVTLKPFGLARRYFL